VAKWQQWPRADPNWLAAKNYGERLRPDMLFSIPVAGGFDLDGRFAVLVAFADYASGPLQLI
jgi:hypothetical protein